LNTKFFSEKKFDFFSVEKSYFYQSSLFLVQDRWKPCLYTIRRSKLHYFRQNYITMKTYRQTT